MRQSKIFISIIAILLTVLTFSLLRASTLTSLAYVYNAPTTTPNGQNFVVMDNLDFSIGSHDWIENDDSLTGKFGY